MRFPGKTLMPQSIEIGNIGSMSAATHSPNPCETVPGPTRRRALGWLSVAMGGAGACVFPAIAASNTRLSLIVAGSAGSVPDQYARRLGALLQAALKVPVVIENKPGANGALSVDALMRAPPDGSTLLVAGLNVMCVMPALKLNTTYEPLVDLEPVAMIASGYPAVIVGAGFPSKTLNDLLERARATPSGLRVGVPGLATAQYLSARQLQHKTGASMQFVPYANASQVLTDLVGGHIDMAIEYASASASLLQAGRLRALAVLGTRRWPILPEVPTALEQGVSGIESEAWLGVVARAGTYPERVNALNQSINRVTTDAEFSAWVQANGSHIRTGTPNDFTELVRKDLGRWSRLVAQAGIRIA